MFEDITLKSEQQFERVQHLRLTHSCADSLCVNAAGDLHEYVLTHRCMQTHISFLFDRHVTTLHLSFCSTAPTAPLITYITGLLTYN